jgi:hypothetical protein
MMIPLNQKIIRIFVCALSCIVFSASVFYATSATAELLERVVAVVDDNAILLSELENEVMRAQEKNNDITEEEVLQDMINRVIILDQIKRFRIGAASGVQKNLDDNALIQRYINRRVKSLIYIPFEEIETYYLSHKEKFQGRELHEVKSEIESQLREGRLKEQLDEHMADLKKGIYIRIQLKE